MSLETDIRALLGGYTPLTTLVGQRIAQDAVPEGSAYPLVVFAVRRDVVTDISGQPLIAQASVTVQCWAKSGVDASAVADQVEAAIRNAPALRGVVVLDRSTAFDSDLNLDGIVFTFQWWA